MSGLVLTDGDLALFEPMFGAASVVVRPGTLQASGTASIRGRKICRAGDEASVRVEGCTYMTPLQPIPGVGALTIAGLAGDQTTSTTSHRGAALMLVGGRFTATFSVTVPAMQPPPGPGAPIPDSTPSYSGGGSFLASNATVTAG